MQSAVTFAIKYYQKIHPRQFQSETLLYKLGEVRRIHWNFCKANHLPKAYKIHRKN